MRKESSALKNVFPMFVETFRVKGGVKKCFISFFCPLEFLACIILGLKHELKIVSTSSQCFLVNWMSLKK